MYRNNDKAASDNESSASEKSDGQLSDTDDDVFQPSAKRSKQNNGMVVEICQGSKFVSKVRRKKDIWSKVMNSQLQDETIKDLVNTAVEGCRTKERGPESFTRPRFTKENKVSEEDGKLSASSIDNSIQKTMEGIDIETSSADDVKQQHQFNDRKFKKAHRRSAHKKPVARFQNGKNNVIQLDYGVPRYLNKKNEVDENSTCADVAQEIAFRLWERKRELMLKMVVFLGVKKALFLYSKAEQIEKHGGMKINQGDRRRTPGGLFIRMIEMDSDVDQKAFQKLLEDDKVEERKRHKERRKLARKRDHEMKQQKNQRNEGESALNAEAKQKADEVQKVQFVAAMET